MKSYFLIWQHCGFLLWRNWLYVKMSRKFEITIYAFSQPLLPEKAVFPATFYFVQPWQVQHYQVTQPAETRKKCDKDKVSGIVIIWVSQAYFSENPHLVRNLNLW